MSGMTKEIYEKQKVGFSAYLGLTIPDPTKENIEKIILDITYIIDFHNSIIESSMT